MKKRWVLKEDAIKFLKKYGSGNNNLKDIDARFNEGQQERLRVTVDKFGKYTDVQIDLWRGDCCELIETDDPNPDEIQVVPVSLSLWQRIKHFFGV